MGSSKNDEHSFGSFEGLGASGGQAEQHGTGVAGARGGYVGFFKVLNVSG